MVGHSNVIIIIVIIIGIPLFGSKGSSPTSIKRTSINYLSTAAFYLKINFNCLEIFGKRHALVKPIRRSDSDLWRPNLGFIRLPFD